ncbi:Hypothetical protein SCLAV_p1565 (plasmid) [Streptomyces clavuligerus]|uniref:Uncharacterized protein n=1 Tax=Streptomyces clavuligerus TaxID=1901 RepID=D5SMA3_STRCL|nr:Hypothetical protein SCLAV_p1565 [Streptomyces clavuligerus]
MVTVHRDGPCEKPVGSGSGREEGCPVARGEAAKDGAVTGKKQDDLSGMLIEDPPEEGEKV